MSVGRIPIMTMSAPRRAGLVLGVVERGAQVVLEAERRVALERARRHVQLDVVGAELGLEGGVRDLLEDGDVAQERLACVVDEVELDLEPGERVLLVALERRGASMRSKTSRQSCTFSR